MIASYLTIPNDYDHGHGIVIVIIIITYYFGLQCLKHMALVVFQACPSIKKPKLVYFLKKSF